jgi:ribosomal protein L14E/L6E/L27E
MLISSKELEIGQFVKSKAGRDKDRLFLVIAHEDEQYVLVADGDLRKVETPKRKKVKHLVKINQISEEVREKILTEKKVSNALVRRTLEKANLI